jgi:hypothetical protein
MDSAMSLVRDVAKGLLGMFVGDAALSSAILAVVAGAALVIKTEVASTQLGGALLFAGCLAVLVGSLFRGARRPQRIG